MTINEQQDRIVSETAGLDDWLDRYEYLIQLAVDMQSDDDLQVEANRLPGCQSQVWIRVREEGGRLLLDADSDSSITRGILALLRKVLNDQPVEEVISAELFVLDKLKLTTNLSPSRANGLQSILRHIRDAAKRLA